MAAQSIGIDTALDRIQQIQAYQQQLLDPSAGATASGASSSTGTSAAATSASTASTTGTASTSGTNFATLLATLENGDSGASASTSPAETTDGTDSTDATGTDGASSELSALTALTSSNPTLLSALASAGASSASNASAPATPTAVQSMVSEANSLIGKPYVWGGGHSGWGSQTGYDCSGFVSRVLHAGGYLATPQDTVGLAQSSGIESGPGQYVTIYDRTDAGSGSDHVIINLGGQFYESGGEAGAWGGGGGVEKIATPSASYLASFNRVLHPAGL